MGEISDNYYNQTVFGKNPFSDILIEMNDLYIKKNKDYGNSFDQTLHEFGEQAALIRISDKFNRLKTLYKTKENFESIDDTLIDLASYCVMTLMYRRKE